MALKVQGDTGEKGAGGRHVMSRVALTNAANANWGVRALNRRAEMLEQNLFESRGRGVDVRIQERCVVSWETTQRVESEGERGTTSPVGMPVLSRGRKASKISKSRTERNRVSRERIPDDLGTG